MICKNNKNPQNVQSYSSIVHAWCKNRDKGAPYQAERRLFQMEQLFLNGNMMSEGELLNTSKFLVYSYCVYLP